MRDEPVHFEAGRPELEDQRAQLGLRLASELPDVVDLGFGARGVGANEAAGGFGGQRQAEEVLRHRVVELAASRLRSSITLSSRLASNRRAFSIAIAACAASTVMTFSSAASKLAAPSFSVR